MRKLWDKLRVREKVTIKGILIFFGIILLPNILRQFMYYLTSLKTGSIDFIASFETQAIFSGASFPFIGLAEEIVIGIVFTAFFFTIKPLRFFSYGWITDAFIDFISVIVWFIFGLTPLQMLGFNGIGRFLIREILFSYVIFGPLLYKSRIDIKKLSLLYTAIGILIMIIIFIF